MTLDQNNYNGLMLKLFEELNNNHSRESGIGSLLEGILNAGMKLERENFIKAKPYERNAERIGYAKDIKIKF